MKPAAVVLLSFLRMDVASREVTERDWPDQRPVAIGSLAKPFVAIAYGQGHEFQYPRVVCRKCWLPRGHGEIGIVEAIAQSCNTYFDKLRGAVTPEALQATAQRFGLETADRAKPESILRAYVELAARREEPGVSPLLEGMRQAAADGTARLLGRDALAKTGTAPCGHTPRAPGDGFAVILYPPEQPREAILVRLHGRPGSHASEAARNILR